jgi:hypothetical protein
MPRSATFLPWCVVLAVAKGIQYHSELNLCERSLHSPGKLKGRTALFQASHVTAAKRPQGSSPNISAAGTNVNINRDLKIYFNFLEEQ